MSERSIASPRELGSRPRRRRRARTRTLRAIVATVCFAATQTACNGSEDVPTARVALVPLSDAAGGPWEWSSTCRVGPRSATGCDPLAPNIGTAQLAGNAWNLGGSAGTPGSVRMSVGAGGGVVLHGDLASAPPCTDATCVAPEANTWVRGFPSVLYGIDQCNAATSPRQSPQLTLPMRVDSIPPSLVGTTEYSAEASEITYTIAYDLWLNPSDTTTPCRTDGTLEVMVWTDHNAASRLPDSMRVQNANIPFSIDGKTESGEGAWSVYVSNVFPEGKTVPWGGTVWFVLEEPHAVTSGTVTVDLSAALRSVGGLLQEAYGWRDFASTYWLDTIAFGIEYGPADGDLYGTGPIDFTMDLATYCLETGVDVEDAGC